MMEHNYTILAEAIIMRAVKDYRKALRHDCRGLKRACERFFRSLWFMSLTNIDANMLIKRLRLEAKNI